MYKPNLTPHEHLNKPPAHTYRRLQDAQRQKAILIRELIRNGATQSQVAQDLGISRQAISQLLAKYPAINYHRAHWASDR